MKPAANIHELNAREAKARKIAMYVVARATEMMEQADDDMWLSAASAAGCNPPSPETRKRVLEMLRGIR